MKTDKKKTKWKKNLSIEEDLKQKLDFLNELSKKQNQKLKNLDTEFLTKK
jgi:hypothetical protein